MCFDLIPKCAHHIQSLCEFYCFGKEGGRNFFFFFSLSPLRFDEVPKGFPKFPKRSHYFLTIGGDFFSSFPGSQYVPFNFPKGSHQVLNRFPNTVSIPPHFYPLSFGNCCPPFTHIGGQKGRNSILQKGTFYFGVSIVWFFWVMGQSNWLIAKIKHKK
jgi:hypothetical protein